MKDYVELYPYLLSIRADAFRDTAINQCATSAVVSSESGQGGLVGVTASD